MSKSTQTFRNLFIAVAAFTVTGFAALPEQALAYPCKTMKTHAQMKPMPYYQPRMYYAPMPRQGYHPHGHGTHHDSCEMQVWHHHHCKPIAKQTKPDRGAATPDASSQVTVDPGDDIVDTASAAENFTTLLRAAEAAGMADTLRGPGPFTVFAPSDAAFAKLPEGTLEALLANKDQLVAVLGYHVVPERLTAADLLQRREFKTVQGTTLTLDELDVAVANIEASNGMIHAVDTVLVPSL